MSTVNWFMVSLLTIMCHSDVMLQNTRCYSRGGNHLKLGVLLGRFCFRNLNSNGTQWMKDIGD